jgi:hypothetical protein
VTDNHVKTLAKDKRLGVDEIDQREAGRGDCNNERKLETENSLTSSSPSSMEVLSVVSV